MYRTPLFSFDEQQSNTISHSEIIKAFLNMQANMEKQNHRVNEIFSNALRRAWDATGTVGQTATGKARQRR